MTILLAVGGLVALGAAPALAGPVEDFRQDGAVDVCQYSPTELNNAADGLPPDVIQYSPGLADQLNAGQEGCGGAGGRPNTVATVPDPGDTDQDGDVDSADLAAAGGGGGTPKKRARVPDPPAPTASARARLADITTPPVSASTGSDVPGWVATLFVALGLGALLFTLARFGGLSTERFSAPLRASFADAGGRTADTLAELWDTVRLGR